MTNNLKAGDVVIIEWQHISPHIPSMKELDGQIGVVTSILPDSIEVRHKEGDETFKHGRRIYLYSAWNWHPSSLTKIGTL